jgi:hypothetical protein
MGGHVSLCLHLGMAMGPIPRSPAGNSSIRERGWGDNSPRGERYRQESIPIGDSGDGYGLSPPIPATRRGPVMTGGTISQCVKCLSVAQCLKCLAANPVTLASFCGGCSGGWCAAQCLASGRRRLLSSSCASATVPAPMLCSQPPSSS